MLKLSRRVKISILIVLAVSLLPLAAGATGGTDLWNTTTEDD